MMKIKKIIISGFSLLLCTMFCINAVSAYELITNSSISEIRLEEEEIKILDQYNKVFIDTGFINEFQLENSSLVCKGDIIQKMNEYSFDIQDQEFIKQIISYSISRNDQNNAYPNLRIQIKNWNIYLTNKEVKKYFGNVLTLGPVAIVGALTALGSVGGPVGSVITFIVSSLGANYIATVVKKAYNSNKGLKIGFSGISVY